jgi:signal transduction histidine kinase
VNDLGRGFDPHRPTDGFGLESMRERVDALGGEFRLASTPGRGTMVEAIV